MSSYAFKKNSPYHAIFNYNLMRFKEAGGLQILNERYHKGRICSSKLDERKPEDISLGMKKVISLFGWLTASFVVALTILIFEKLAHSQTNKHSSSYGGYKAATKINIKMCEQLENILALLTEDWDPAERREFVERIKQLIIEHDGKRLCRAPGYALDMFGCESRF